MSFYLQATESMLASRVRVNAAKVEPPVAPKNETQSLLDIFVRKRLLL